jgi:hypothetical protein
MNSVVTQKWRGIKASVGLWKDAAVPETKPPFRLQTDFFPKAEILWAQFEKHLKDAGKTSDGLTPLLYAFCKNTYQFLTASADRVFSRELLEEFTGVLRKWANVTHGFSNVSTPQVRVYIAGCKRDLLRDDSEVNSHYILWLGRNGTKKSSRIKLVTKQGAEGLMDGSPTIERVFTLQLAFNQLLVHDARDPYAIESGSATDPLEGSVFLDGYLW